MPLTREQKNAIIEQYTDLLRESYGVVLADYRGLTVKDLEILRRKAREAGGKVQVVKNTLFRIALQRAGLPVPAEFLIGPVIVGFGVDDVPPLAKAFIDFAQDTKVLQVKGGLLGDRVLDVQEVENLAELPSMEELRAQMVAAVQGPLTSLVGIISAPLREIAYVLQARSEQAEAA